MYRRRSVLTFAILILILTISLWATDPENQQIVAPKTLSVEPVRHEQLQAELSLSVRHLLASRSVQMLQQAQAEHKKIGKRVADSAVHYVGTPYVWGGTKPSGFDCSGFTQYILKQYGGIAVPRNSYDQFNVGQTVSRQELQPGDLVFFSTYAPGPSHLGIYVGAGKFVHALNPEKGVTTSTLDTDYYKTRFVGARRVIGSSAL
ncbi:C40 family peptidase [Tumebacillus permanentifrigoris]|nr:C40 family peptidase [Tumebacillus permanentifrigoris]